MAHLYCTLLVIGGYLLGSASSAILITRLWTGKDIRALGNRNAGGANVARSVGLAPAAIVVFFDISKGALPIMIAHLLGLTEACGIGGAVAAVLGHSYPLYFRFRGGQGLTVSLGALLALTPFETLLILPVLGMLYLVITGSAVVSAATALLLLVGLNLWRGYPLIIVLSPLIFLGTMGLCIIPRAFSDWRERANKRSVVAQWLSPKMQRLEKPGIAVITDSVASLPAEWSTREGIHIIPMTLILPDGVYRDGVEVEPRQYYQRLREEHFLPKTSAPSPGEFLSIYQQLAQTHRIGIVITPPKELTRTWESAYLATQMDSNPLQVEVVDSRTAGPAQGFIAVAAARAASSGADMTAVLESIRMTQKDVGFVGVLDTVKYLVEGGRGAELHQWLDSALRVYPILYIHEGRINLVGAARTKSKAVERMLHWLKDKLPAESLSLAIVHTDAFQEAEDLKEKLMSHFRPDEHFVAELTPVIGAHAGPGLVGVAWWIHPPPMQQEENLKP
jgi:acyl-phosphate glycerol 3-phosphate acyltransferase